MGRMRNVLAAYRAKTGVVFHDCTAADCGFRVRKSDYSRLSAEKMGAENP